MIPPGHGCGYGHGHGHGHKDRYGYGMGVGMGKGMGMGIRRQIFPMFHTPWAIVGPPDVAWGAWKGVNI